MAGSERGGLLGEPAAAVELAQKPGVRWPADWRMSGDAFGRAEWSADVHGDMREQTDIARGGTLRVFLHTQLGTLVGLVMLVDVVLDSAGAVTHLVGQGPLLFVRGAQ